MDIKTTEFLLSLKEYQGLFGILSILFLITSAGLIIWTLSDLIATNAKRKYHASDDDLKNFNYAKVKKERKGEILRSIIAPDAVDPGPNSYFIINDGGVDTYVRSLTIAQMPKRTRFADTFSTLFDFPGCTSSVIVNPVSEVNMTRHMDRQITILASEYTAAEDINRQRKIKNQYQEAYNWAEEVESGDTKFFDVGFVFSISADSIHELNKKTDLFHSKALSKGIFVTNCYAVQAEAYLTNGPYDNYLNIDSKIIKSDAIKYFKMDKYSLSTIFNYTQSSFSHKDGLPLGRDMNTEEMVFFDLFDETHDGYTLVIAGKTGSGKSLTIKVYAARSMLQGYKYVCIDSQQRKGTNEGEFAAIAEVFNGVNFKLSNESVNVINPFEVRETTKTVKATENTVREVRTLELNDKISMAVNSLSTMMQGSENFNDLKMSIAINRLLTDNVTEIYHDFGIYDGVPDSLYEQGVSISSGGLTTGLVAKKLPTMTDFYKKVLESKRKNTDSTMDEPYNMIIFSLKDFVRELYYSVDTLHFFTREEYYSLPKKDGARSEARYYKNSRGQNEDVIEVHGIRSYYDGQTTIDVNSDCPFTNIDLSLLPENEKILARQIAIDFVNESFIKKNSETIQKSEKLVAIFDECHENFSFEYARKTLDNVVRTARKRHCGIILSSQTVKEYANYTETEAILKQATAKFVFKQDYQDMDYLIKTLGITDSQSDYIVNRLGGNSSDEEDKNKHRGEMCIIDGQTVCFCKVDYLRETEELFADTNAENIARIYAAS